MLSTTRRAVLALTAACTLLAPPLMAQDKPLLAFVTNASADFWTIARRGAETAAAELPDYQVEFIVPSESTPAEQRRIIDDLLARGVAGVAISPVNAESATDTLNRVAAEAVLFTSDSDAPESDRMVYIGTDNVAAGVQAGELMKEAMPEGGEAMLFVGSMDNANARERVEGIRTALEGSNITIVDVRTDEIDFVKARRNVEDTLTAYPDIDMLVGLYSYNPPQIIAAVESAGKGGEVKIVAFDEDVATLRGIRDGLVYGTVVQQPYEFGYQSIVGMAKAIEGDTAWIPENKLNIVPTKIINAENVEEFEGTMREMLSN
jgi:ribose transport system substrate-binding protein